MSHNDFSNKEDPYTTRQALIDLRAQMLDCHAGSLATLCREGHPLAGYPVSSVVPFVLDDDFNPVILIADIAEHTHNALANPKASIFIREGNDRGNVQTQWRICMIGDLLPLPEAEVPDLSEHYYRHYPAARDYHQTHGFRFFRLNLKKYRIIMGFGAIRWIKAEAVYEKNPFGEAERLRMINHMNDDHMNAMRRYLRQRSITIADDAEVRMTALHPYGFTLRHGDALHFIPFAEAVRTPQAVREALVQMAKS
ncbi:MAG: DUF2470 domain-containing protein [Cardiobacteriaceae bacterium]|nr:DUF2470 domain-containing protein [Cardiobacteriaceae bacterium]